ncbi:MAG: alpha/beta hydrolase [Bacillota bacterium]|nr:alpha/beta hydrolase [Bacillota bacterium]
MTGKRVDSGRLSIFLRQQGEGREPILVLIHGNLSTGVFFEPLMEELPRDLSLLAPDLRGFGRSDKLPIDATKGLKDLAEDVHALLEALQLGQRPLHFLGWSAGGGVIAQYVLLYPEEVASLILVNPVSPFGYGGTKDEEGTPCTPDFAGSGAGGVNPAFLEALQKGDRSTENPAGPRQVMNQFYFAPPFRSPREEDFLTAMLETGISPDIYPGEGASSPYWPFFAPGKRGINNALSPAYLDWSPIVNLERRPPILWIRGERDQIVSDASPLDAGYLGQLGLIPGWPGPDEFPPQPMVSQTRRVLSRYETAGGSVREIVMAGVGHSPHVENPPEFAKILLSFLREAGI